MMRMLDLGDVFQWVVDSLHERAFTQQKFVKHRLGDVTRSPKSFPNKERAQLWHRVTIIDIPCRYFHAQ